MNRAKRKGPQALPVGVYIATVDLLPEIRNHQDYSWQPLLFFLLGLGMMFLV